MSADLNQELITKITATNDENLLLLLKTDYDYFSHENIVMWLMNFPHKTKMSLLTLFRAFWYGHYISTRTWWSNQAMAYEIIYTKRFSQKLFKLLDYLRSEWGEPVADKFIIELKNRLRSLSQHPFIATPSLVVKPVRSILITKKTEYFIE